MFAQLPLPPALNHCYRAAINNNRPYLYKTSAAKQWQEEAGWILKTKFKKEKLPITEPVAVHIHLYLKHDRDIDSSHKLLLDTLQFVGIIANDKQVKLLITEKQVGDPKLEIKISKYHEIENASCPYCGRPV